MVQEVVGLWQSHVELLNELMAVVDTEEDKLAHAPLHDQWADIDLEKAFEPQGLWFEDASGNKVEFSLKLDSDTRFRRREIGGNE